jgi:hypothetical protein
LKGDNKMSEQRDWFSEKEQLKRGKFVRSLVFFSGAVGVSCGAMTEGGPGDQGTSSGGTGPGSGGQGQATGGSGGLVTGGGSISTGGDLVLSTGGQVIIDPVRPTTEWPKYEGFAGTAGAAGGFGVFECPPAQYTCDVDFTRPCGGQIDFDPTQCSCDLSRPTEQADCAADEFFVCYRGTPVVDGARQEDAAISCFCSAGPASCNLCAPPDQNPRFLTCEADPDNQRVLCGCAVIVLK